VDEGPFGLRPRIKKMVEYTTEEKRVMKEILEEDFTAEEIAQKFPRFGEVEKYRKIENMLETIGKQHGINGSLTTIIDAARNNGWYSEIANLVEELEEWHKTYLQRKSRVCGAQLSKVCNICHKTQDSFAKHRFS
jgi:hypothetical protein